MQGKDKSKDKSKKQIPSLRYGMTSKKMRNDNQ
jgi:hypothetical protein